MGQSGDTAGGRSRCIGIVGPYLSGKTTLLEAILARCGAITRQGRIGDRNTVGDNTPEARDHAMSIELNAATLSFMDEDYTFLDCPGSVEFQYDAAAALAGCDAVVVVCEPDEKKVPALQVILKQLEDRNIPHYLFLNKIDKVNSRIRDVLPILQPASSIPLVLRQIPIWNNGIATGFVDLALERAYVYQEHAPSEVIEIPGDLVDRETEARFGMLEQLADYDDKLMEQLLEDIPPPRDQVFEDLKSEVRDGLICPVFLGSAEHGNGILRLMKALRHEAPTVAETAERLGVADTPSSIQVVKTLHSMHGGKLSLARVLRGDLADGATLFSGSAESRASGLFRLNGQDAAKCDKATAGATVAIGRLEGFATGDTLAVDAAPAVRIEIPAPPQPVYGLAIAARERKDEVRLTSAISKLTEEDPSLSLDHSQELAEMVLWGQGEMHLRVALERLTRKFGVEVATRPRQVPYRETIRKPVEVRGRHKKQSGGHGQFGDVVIEIKPLPRGSGFQFTNSISGGVVPKQYIPSVEHGVQEYLRRGPLGFELVDIAVNLKDGSYHTVDSSDMAFKTAGRIAMAEGVPQCSPVLLEPISAVEIAVPSEATAKVNAIVSSRRGQILGFDARPGWNGWDIVQAQLPEAEIQNLIVELRSATAGVGTFTSKFDHLAELNGRVAEDIVREHAKEAA